MIIRGWVDSYNFLEGFASGFGEKGACPTSTAMLNDVAYRAVRVHVSGILLPMKPRGPGTAYPVADMKGGVSHAPTPMDCQHQRDDRT
jgi:hypothetical protein